MSQRSTTHRQWVSTEGPVPEETVLEQTTEGDQEDRPLLFSACPMTGTSFPSDGAAAGMMAPQTPHYVFPGDDGDSQFQLEDATASDDYRFVLNPFTGRIEGVIPAQLVTRSTSRPTSQIPMPRPPPGSWDGQGCEADWHLPRKRQEQQPVTCGIPQQPHPYSKVMPHPSPATTCVPSSRRTTVSQESFPRPIGPRLGPPFPHPGGVESRESFPRLSQKPLAADLPEFPLPSAWDRQPPATPAESRPIRGLNPDASVARFPDSQSAADIVWHATTAYNDAVWPPEEDLSSSGTGADLPQLLGTLNSLRHDDPVMRLRLGQPGFSPYDWMCPDDSIRPTEVGYAAHPSYPHHVITYPRPAQCASTPPSLGTYWHPPTPSFAPYSQAYYDGRHGPPAPYDPYYSPYQHYYHEREGRRRTTHNNAGSCFCID